MDARGHFVPLEMISEAEEEEGREQFPEEPAGGKCKQALLFQKCSHVTNYPVLHLQSQHQLCTDGRRAGRPSVRPPRTCMCHSGDSSETRAPKKLPGASPEAGDFLKPPCPPSPKEESGSPRWALKSPNKQREVAMRKVLGIFTICSLYTYLYTHIHTHIHNKYIHIYVCICMHICIYTPISYR